MKRVVASLLIGLCVVGAVFGQGPRVKREVPYVPPKRWALLIGAENYQAYSKLQFAAEDAKAMAKTLVDDYRFEAANVSTLTDETGAEAPTVANIRARLDLTLKNKSLDRADLFVFYFSGHGAGTAAGDFLLPTDTKRETVEQQGLPVKQIIQSFVDAGLKNVLIICDACRSGTENPFGAELQELGKKANIAVILGCSPGTRSYEYENFHHGIFTHYLLKALAAREPKEEATGALWASGVAKQVQAQVAERTERDYGINAQKPAVWTEPTQDVLLGAFVPATLNAENLKSFESQAAKLNQKDYGTALSTYAEQLYMADHYPEAIQLYKTLDAIGEMTASSRYTYSSTLSLLGRTVEASKAFDQLAKEGDSMYANLGICSNPSRTVPPAVRVKAIESLWKQSPDWNMALLASAILADNATDAKRAEVLTTILKEGTFTDYQRAYLTGALRSAEGKLDEAATAYESALKIGGEYDNTVRLLLLPLYTLTQNTAKAAALYQTVPADVTQRAAWYLLAGLNARNMGDKKGMLTYFKKGLENHPDPNELLSMVKNGGLEIYALADELLAEANRHPYAWKAIVVKALCEGVIHSKEGDQQDQIGARLTEAIKYADDEAAAYATMIEILDPLLTAAHDRGKVPDEQFALLWLAYSGQMMKFGPQLGFDADLWFDTMQYGLRAERNMQLARLIDIYLTPALAKGDVDPSLKTMAIIAAINAGDTPRAQRIVASGLPPADTVNAPWFVAIGLIGEGKDAEAAKLILSAAKPSVEFGELEMALRAFAEVTTGKKAAGKARLTGLTDSDPGVVAAKALTLDKLGLAAEAEKTFVKAVGERSWRYLPLSMRALKRLVAIRRQQGRNDEAIQLVLAAQVQAGNPLYQDLTYLPQQRLSDLVGKYDLRGVIFNDDNAYTKLELKMTVSPSGVVSGMLGEIKLEGKVDAQGNASGRATNGPLDGTWETKLAPPSVMARLPAFKMAGQAIFIYLPNGLRLMAALVVPP